MLEISNYVRCLMIDFSKAFDTVDHVLLLNKLVQLSSIICYKLDLFFLI